MPGCAIATCKNFSRNTKGTAIKYFGFPKNEDLAKQWIVACRRDDKINFKNATICSLHFEVSCFNVPLKQKLLKYTPKNSRNLKPDAVPTLSLPLVPGTSKKVNNEERSLRLAKRRRRDEVNYILQLSSFNELQTSNDDTQTLSNPKSIPEEPALCIDDNVSMDVDVEHQLRESRRINHNEIMELNERIKVLEEHNNELVKKIEVKDLLIQKYENVLAKVFTPGQIRNLMNSEKETKIRWSPKDIASAVSLRSVSPKAYRFLRANNYPLPAMSTLRNWVSNFDVSAGILKSVITLMKKKAPDFTKIDRMCVITFDEVYVSNKIDIDKKQEQAVGPHKSCQTVMVRGLISNWKQPVYYQFDQPMIKDILETIISELFRADFIVVAICSDMGTGNTSLWTKLNVGYNKNCFFYHPCDDSLKIFVYADVPHLIKLARNHLIDKGFNLEDHLINVDYFEALLNISTSELTFAHKLTQKHLNLKGSMRQRVRPAVQVFSNSVAKAIEYSGDNGLMPKNSSWKKAAEIVQLFNDWFDLLNSRSKFVGNCPGRNAFGTDINNQKNLLDKMLKVINSMRVGKHKELIPFQKGILLTNRSLLQMYDYLQEKYNIEYILTSRLNQDVLENFFAYIRGMGGANDHPFPLDFKYRLRWYILGKHSAAIFTENKNTVETNESTLLNILNETSASTGDSKLTQEICLTQSMLSTLVKEKEYLEETTRQELESPLDKLMLNSFIEPQYLEEEVLDDKILDLMEIIDVKEKVNQESLKYISGFVAYKFQNKYTLGVPTEKLDIKKAPDWLQMICRGSLLHPNNELWVWEATVKMDAEFHKMHGYSLSKEKHIFKEVAQRTLAQLKNNSVPFEVILYLSRTRTYIRLRDLNRKISFQNCQRKLDKKMLKITNLKK